MTHNEKKIALALVNCNYLPGSFEKRFARDMASIARTEPDKELSEKQRTWLYKQAWRKRKSLPPSVLAVVPKNGELLTNRT